MKFEFKKNKNRTVDIMYKSNDITINLHGNTQEVETVYRIINYNYLNGDAPAYLELNKYDNYSYEIPDAIEEPEESDDEYVKTYREAYKERNPRDSADIHCVNEEYYGTTGCRFPGSSISCSECWNMELGT